MGLDGILSVENLAYRYPQNGHGLEIAELTVRPGEAVLITGDSGCGKSTLARCLTGLIPHLYRGRLTGEVRVDGLSTSEAPLWRLTERAGMVFQNPASQMLAASVEDEIIFGLENLGLSPQEIRLRLEAVVERFDLGALRARVPLTLSGGEQQRLALAAITARQPPVLVLDEPLSMLDSAAVEHLVGYLAELVLARTTVVICEHRVEPLRHLPGLRTVDLNRNDGARCGWYAPGKGVPVPEIPGRGRETRPFTLEVSGLGVRLGGRAVLEDLSFSAHSGQVLAIVGRNGVGKTTLLRALAGLQRHGGVAAVDGERPDFAMVFQNPDLQLFNATVRDEILYKVPDPDWARYEWLVCALGLEPYQDTPPLLLSEGEKKRLALATALMRGPRHGVLLDEPALGQDTVHKAQLVHLARALAGAGHLVVMTTHELSLAARADRMLLLGQDGFVADGPPDAVLRDRAAWEKVDLVVPDWVLELA